MDRSTKESLAESEVILNRTNIALARSRKLIESWISCPKSADSEVDEAEEDFTAESETAGIGSLMNVEEENGLLRGLGQGRLGSKDNLLEQILGKKAAQAHKKSRGASNVPTDPQHVSSKRSQGAAGPNKRKAESDDEEDGRGSAFMSKNARRTEAASGPKTLLKSTSEHVNQDQPPSSSDARASAVKKQALPTSYSGRKDQLSSKKAISYLDEILAQNSGKKKRKNQVKPAAEA